MPIRTSTSTTAFVSATVIEEVTVVLSGIVTGVSVAW
jgi:hypothetical protein